jgi:hypothetical protein
LSPTTQFDDFSQNLDSSSSFSMMMVVVAVQPLDSPCKEVSG